jgi:hypothetical protein
VILTSRTRLPDGYASLSVLVLAEGRGVVAVYAEASNVS